MRPEDDPGWASYHATVLVFPGQGGGRIDLAHPPGSAGLALLQVAGLPGPFGLVTPENPRGQPTSPAVNQQRWEAFRAGPAGAAVQVDGVNAGASHRERGVALRWRREDVIALAREWQQSAIYWWDGCAFWLVGALTCHPPERLRQG